MLIFHKVKSHFNGMYEIHCSLLQNQCSMGNEKIKHEINWRFLLLEQSIVVTYR